MLDLVRRKAAGPMDHEPRPAPRALPPNRHVDRRIRRLEQMPEDGGGAVADRGPLAAGENGRHLAGQRHQRHMADGVDTAMKTMKTMARQSCVDSARANARLEQLGAGDDPILLGGQVRDDAVPRTTRRPAIHNSPFARPAGPRMSF